MTFELYTWGPAFGLPSLDAECISAIAYLGLAIPEDQWIIVESYDTSASPTGSFPLVNHEDSWIGGFPAIVSYLSSRGFTADEHLTARQRAHCTAVSSHLNTHAPPLIAAYLYGSPTTYSALTHPAITHLLPYSQTFTTPASLRARAQAVAASAGLGSTTVTESEPAPGVTNNAQDLTDAQLASSASPSLIFQRRQNLQSVLRKEESVLRFRVEAALEELVGPLEGVLKQDPSERKSGGSSKECFLVSGTTLPSSADCLAFGYLSLLLYPQVPAAEAFLTNTLRKRYPATVSYIDRLRERLVSSKNEFAQLKQNRAALPRTATASANLLAPFKHALHTTLRENGLIASEIILTNSSSPKRTETAAKTSTTPYSLSLIPTTALTTTLLASAITIPLSLLAIYITRTQWFYYTWTWLNLDTRWIPNVNEPLWSIFGLDSSRFKERDKHFESNRIDARRRAAAAAGMELKYDNDDIGRSAANPQVLDDARDVIGALFR